MSSAGVYHSHRTMSFVFFPFINFVQYDLLHILDRQCCWSTICASVYSNFCRLDSVTTDCVFKADFWHGRCVYNVIYEEVVFDAMSVNGDGVALNADDAKQSCAA